MSRVLVLLCVFLFSRGFLWFLVKKKNRENFFKKQDPTDYLGPRGSHRAMVSRVLFFFVLLIVFSKFLVILVSPFVLWGRFCCLEMFLEECHGIIGFIVF